MKISFDGRTVAVSGAAHGFGRCIARNRIEHASQRRARVTLELGLRDAGFLKVEPVVGEQAGLAQHVQRRRRAALTKGNTESDNGAKHVRTK